MRQVEKYGMLKSLKNKNKRSSHWTTLKNTFNLSYFNGLKVVKVKKSNKKIPRGDKKGKSLKNKNKF